MTRAALVALAVLAGALVKGVTGLGLPPIALAALAPILGAEHAVVVLALPTVASNATLVWSNRSWLRESRHLPALMITGVVGALVGARLLVWLDDAAVAIGVGVVVLIYAVLYLLRPDLALPPRATRLLAAPVGGAAGVLQGATGLSSPVLATYLHARRLPRGAYLLTISLLFQVFALAQLAGIVVFGLFDDERILHALVATVAALAGVPLGMRAGRRLPQTRFEQVTLAVMLLSTTTLILGGLGVGPWGV